MVWTTWSLPWWSHESAQGRESVVSLKVVGLNSYPVKSMLGVAHERLDFDERGAVGDRLWALRHADGKLSSGKNSRRFRRVPGMLEHTAAYDADGTPLVTAPDGEILRPGDPRIPERFGEGVELAREGAGSHQDAAAVSLVGTASLRALGDLLGDSDPVDVRRLRKNIVVETDEPWIEESWVGREITIGGTGTGTGAGEPLRLRVTERVGRCVMTTQAQTGLPADNRVLKTLTAARGMCIGVYADIVAPAPLAIGDTVVAR